MRRGAVAAIVLCSARAVASPWSVSVEGGAEYDSNVQRVETGPELPTEPTTAPVVRFGGRVAKRAALAGGNYGFALSALSRLVAQGDPALAPEDVVLFVADARYLHPIEDRPLSLGVALTGADAVAVNDDVGARTFVNLGADALLALRDDADDGHHLTLAVGARVFEYKPDPAFDWTGPAASLRLDLALWQDAEKTRSLELAGIAGIDLRSYASNAFADACPPDVAPMPECFAPTTRPRHDRYHRVGVELTWTGGVVAGLGYQLIAIDSNSYGQSLVRHRMQASATIDVGAEVYATALAIVQLEQYLDGLVIATDPDQQSFTSLEDENRSSISLRLGRPLTAAWSVETRAVYWRNLSGSSNDFERATVYLGAMYSH